jgi:hypothetical protein
MDQRVTMRCHLGSAAADYINDKCDTGPLERPDDSASRDGAAPKSDAVVAKYAASGISSPEGRVYGHSKEHFRPREPRQEMSEHTY